MQRPLIANYYDGMSFIARSYITIVPVIYKSQYYYRIVILLNHSTAIVYL